MRDFDPEDRQRVVRNLGGANFSVLGPAGLSLVDQPELQDALRMSGTKTLVGGAFWSGATTASQKVSATEMARYPSWLGAESPFTRFVVLPSLEGASTWQTLRIRSLDADFQADWVNQFLKERLKTSKANDLYPSREVWESPSAFAVWIPWIYGKVLQRGLALAHGRVGLTHTATSEPPNSGRLVNFYDTSGAQIGADRHSSTSDSLEVDQDLAWVANALPATPDTFEELQSWVQTQIAEADFLYGMDDLAGGRSLYQEVVTAVALFDPDADYEEGAATDELGEISYGNDTPGGTSNPPGFIDIDIDGHGFGGTYHTGTRGGESSTLEDSAAAAGAMFGPNFPVAATLADTPSVEMDTVLAGTILPGYVNNLGWAIDDDDGYKGYIWEHYLHANAMIKMIDLGLNMLGYRPDYVPPWATDHMYGVARDMCNRALEAEQRVPDVDPASGGGQG